MIRLLVMADARSIHTQRWCRYFEEAGWETALFSLEPCTISPPRHFYGGNRPTSIGTIDYYLARRRFLSVLEQFRPDIVSAHYVVSYGWLASYGTVCPVTVTAWGSDLLLLPQKSFMHRMRVRRALQHAKFCTVDNQNLADAAARFTSPRKIVRIIMGIDRNDFQNMAKDRFAADGTLHIIAPRGLQKVYAPKTIIEAAALLKGKLDFRIDLLGTGAEMIEMGERIKRNGLADIIALSSPMLHRDFIAGLKDYDIYLSASLSDSTSVALLEGMAAGLFPVTSDIAGNRFWIQNGQNGLLFKPGSPSSLAQALIRASEMRSQFASTASVNRHRIEGEAIWQDNMDRLKQLFVELMK